MHILGLTGSIGMGKSTAAAMLRRMRVPVHCADEIVHQLLSKGGKAVSAVAKLYPPAFNARTRSINRKVLGRAAFDDARLMKKLEVLLHPLVQKAERDFLKRAKAAHAPVVVLDIPLLFETGGEQRVDAVIVVSAPAALQKKRVLARKHMTAEKFKAILKKQMPDAQKRKRADFIVPTGSGRAVTRAALKAILKKITIPTN